MNTIYTGNRISEARKQKGMTQKELARKLYVTDKAVSKRERGLNFPDISILERVAEVLEISVVELLGIENSSGEEIVSDMAEVAINAQRKIAKEICIRGWITAVSGIAVWVFLMYASRFLPDSFLYGTVATAYIGIPVGLIIGNGLVSVFKGIKLKKMFK